MNLRFIKFTHKYLEFLRCLRNNPEIRSNVGDGKYISKSRQLKWWNKYIDGYYDFNIRIIMYGNLPIGYVNAIIDKEKETIDIGASIHPYYHGKGIGKIIYLELLNRCEKLNYLVKLWVYADNIKAYNLYKNIGFIERDSYMHENGREIIIMEHSKLKRASQIH